MIDPNHPAVEAAVKGWFGTATGSDEGDMCAALTAAQEHYTPDDLRNTPAGRALLAEGWDRGAADNQRDWVHSYDGHDVAPDDPLGECQTCCTPNPYKETSNE